MKAKELYLNQIKGVPKMKKTTIEISEEQYFFLKKKVLDLQKQNINASIISIIRDLIDRDMEDW
ncbi:MAG: hypothetical protein QW763_06520 [Archaeoglobaceae archaeon]